MKPFIRTFGVVAVGGLLMTVCLWALGIYANAPALAAPIAQSSAPEPSGGFITVGAAVNTNQDALMPALAIRPGDQAPFVVRAQAGQIQASQFATATDRWVRLDGALNRSLANIGFTPAIDLAGQERNVPWVAWIEGGGQVNAAWFNGSNWALTPLLNRNADRQGFHSALAAGAAVSGAVPLPWVAWSEYITDFAKISVSQAVADGGAQGGYRWQPVGEAFSFAPAHSTANPDIAFAGDGLTTPWVTWQEASEGQPSHVYVRRFVADTWQTVGRQDNCGDDANACALNLNPLLSAGQPHIAAGRLANEITSTPWVVFSEVTINGGSAIRVMRLDVGSPDDPSDDRFVPVGGAVNEQCLGNGGLSGEGGADPDIVFVGNVPHVAWTENQNHQVQLFVCHLADVRPGQERWDLDSYTPLNRGKGEADWISLASNGSTPYVTWQEGEQPTNVYVARRVPAGPAWGNNYPPSIGLVTPRNSLADIFSTVDANFAAAVTADSEAASEPVVQSKPVEITTFGNHVNGWEQLDEVQFKLSNGDETAFLARYVVDENKVYVQDPDHPGVFFPGVTPGPGSPSIPTRYVTLLTAQMSVVSHGSGSPTLDIHWMLQFEDESFLQRYDQAINIFYTDPEGDFAPDHTNGAPIGRPNHLDRADVQSTGFFRVGEVYVGQQSFLPIVAN